MENEDRYGVTTADIAGEEHHVGEQPREHQQAGRPTASEDREPLTPLFADNRVQDLRKRWHDLQVSFVDDPRRAVQQADELVAQVMKDLAKSFADERGKLEQQWDKGDQVSTEDLRVALRRYRSFFERFLSM